MKDSELYAEGNGKQWKYLQLEHDYFYILKISLLLQSGLWTREGTFEGGWEVIIAQGQMMDVA